MSLTLAPQQEKQILRDEEAYVKLHSKSVAKDQHIPVFSPSMYTDSQSEHLCWASSKLKERKEENKRLDCGETVSFTRSRSF